MPCSIEGCEKPVKSSGLPWCDMHYYRNRRHGDPLATMRPGFGDDPIVRFMLKVNQIDGGCWEWTGWKDRRGYGGFDIRPRRPGQSAFAHRFAYEYYVGPIPEELELDHLCRNTGCVNPEHLEPVTHAENVRRAFADQTHCKRGHEFTPENTYSPPGHPTRRCCRACARIRKGREAA